MFGVSHFLLAMKFKRMSKAVPALLDGKHPKQNTKCDIIAFWTVIVLSILFPLLTMLVGIEYRLRELHGYNTGKWILISKNISITGIGLIEVVSGIILVNSVYNIYRYFADRKKTDFIDTGMLLRHAGAYGVYTVCTFAYFAALDYALWTDPTVDLINSVAAVGLPVEICSFISQVLLVLIFKVLGQNLETALPEDKSSILSLIIVTEFDEDAELQARMWNSLVNKERLDNSGRQSLHISGKEISAAMNQQESTRTESTG